MKKIIGILVCTLLMATSVQVVTSLNKNVDDYGKNLHTASFSQLDWYYHGTPLMLNSLWGRIDVLTTPDSSFWYMNVLADAGYGPAWILKNYPIFPIEYNLPNEQVVYFNIKELGLMEGMSLEGISAIISFDRSPQQIPPHGEMYAYDVDSSIRDAWGHSQDPPQTVGEPVGHNATGEVTDAIKHKNVPSVQEDPDNCITGSYARSIKWLDNEYDLENLPAGETAQDVYDDLAGLGVGHGTGQGLTEEEMLEEKTAYLKGLDGRAVTKFVDLTGWMSDDVTGCTEETPDNLKDWLEDELKTEDVEMCYDSHCIIITGIYTQGGKTFLEYRDDESQGDDDAGDTAEKEGELTQVGGGWSFDGAQVDYVVSESINEAPDEPAIDGPTGGKPRIPYEYDFTTTDPNSDQLFYVVNWGDGTPEVRIGPYNSSDVATATHTWSKRGTYIIKAKAVDIYNASSDWTTLEVIMPRGKILPNQLFLQFLQNHPHMFPILRRLMGL